MNWQNPRLGITGEALGREEQLAEFFGVKEGVLVKSVVKKPAAEKAGQGRGRDHKGRRFESERAPRRSRAFCAVCGTRRTR